MTTFRGTYESMVVPDTPKGSYPVILGHCVAAFVSWRTYDLNNAVTEKPSPVYGLVTPFFCYGYGGGLIRDWVLGQTPASVLNENVFNAWIWAWILTNDTVYELCKPSSPFNPVKACILGLDAIDSAGGVCASVEKCQKLFPENPYAPFVGGMLISVGGSLFRYVELKSRGKNPRTELSKPTAIFKRGAFYTLLYMFMKKFKTPREARILLVTMHIIWSMMNSAAGIDIFPFLV